MRKILMTAVVLLAMTAPALAGDIPYGVVPPPPPPPNEVQTTEIKQFEDDADETVLEVALRMIQGVLSIF